MNLNIRSKLLLGFGLVLLLTSAVNIYGLFQMNVLAGLTADIYNHPLRVITAVLHADADIVRIHRGMKDVVLNAEEADLAALVTEIDGLEAKVNEHLGIVQEWILGDEGRALVGKTIQDFAAWKPIRDEVISLTQAMQLDQAEAMAQEKGADHVALLEADMSALRDYAANKALGMYTGAQDTRNQAITTTIIALVVAVFSGGVIGVALSRRIAGRIGAVSQVALKLSQGDLRADIESQDRDELGQLAGAVRTIILVWRGIVDDLRASASRLASTANQLASSASEVERTANSQSDQIVQVSTSMEEMSRAILEVANNAEATHQAAITSSQQAQDGAALVQDAIAGIGRSNARLQQLKTRSDEIDAIISLIQEIAAQTNILALNAAIEAAGAGQAGARFNVVADEIRKLALRTAESTAEIGNLINAVQADVRAAVSAMEEGTEMVQQVGSQLTEIVETSVQASDMMQLVSTSAVQQTTTSEEIASALEHVAVASQQTVAATQETAQVSDEMSNLAERLKETTNQFKV